MGLWSSLGVGRSAIQAAQLGLEVAGHNISNASAPGYARQRTVIAANPARDEGSGLIVGTGATVTSIQAMVDRHLEDRLRAAVSDAGSLATRYTYLGRVESTINELGDQDLSTALSEFFSAVQDLQPDPSNEALRTILIQRAENLATRFGVMRQRLDDTRAEVDARIVTDVSEVNRLTAEIAVLNQKIVEREQGGSGATANDLRNQRTQALEDLGRIIDVRVIETPAGDVNITIGNEMLVQGTLVNTLRADYTTDRGMRVAQVVMDCDGRAVSPSGGELAGLIASRDDVLGGVVDDLDQLAAALIREVNLVHASGQGLRPFTSVTSSESVTDPDAALGDAGLRFPVQHGSFDITVVEQETGVRQTTTIPVDVDGLESDGTLTDVAADLDAIDGIHAYVDSHNRLVIETESDRLGFTFSNDTSGFLADIGINTFFSGSDSRTMAVAAGVADDPTMVAVALNGEPGDASNLSSLLAIRDRTVADLDGLSLSDYLETTMTTWASQTAQAQAESEAADVFVDTLRAEREALSGVSLDEEALDLIRFERTFQAAARFISTVDDLIRMLLEM